jgi:hypothetical protein
MTGAKDPEHDFGETPEIRYEDLDNAAHRRAVTGIGSEWTIEPVDGSRQYRLKMLMIRGTNEVQDLWIVNVERDTSTEVMHLTGESAARFVAIIRNNAFTPADGSPVVVPPAKVLPDATALSAAYEHDPTALRLLIEKDATAGDVVAVAHRRQVVDEFRRMIDDEVYFDALVAVQARKSKEGVWQEYFEANPWLLGLGLSAHLLIGWDEDKLEKVVVGADIGGPGKRADAVVETAGVIGLLALAEIKHHRTDLLANGIYRSGCWPPSTELSGAVAQSHGTVQLTLERLINKVEKKDDEGFTVPAETTYIYRPRSYVVIGQLSEFLHPETGGRNEAMVRSFELYRRNLHEPIVITFDELLARAEALVATHAELRT